MQHVHFCECGGARVVTGRVHQSLSFVLVLALECFALFPLFVASHFAVEVAQHRTDRGLGAQWGSVGWLCFTACVREGHSRASMQVGCGGGPFVLGFTAAKRLPVSSRHSFGGVADAQVASLAV